MASSGTIFVIPRAQTLRFVRIDNYPSNYQNGQNFANRLLMDEIWAAPDDNREYLQKINPGDPILIQLTTNYDPDNITIELIDEDGNIDENGIFEKTTMYSYTDSSGNVVYNYLLDQSSITFNGFYYILITVEQTGSVSLTYRSESFEFGDYEELPYITWKNSNRDGIYWDDGGETIFGIRAEIHVKYSAQSESSVYQGFTFQPETLNSVDRMIIEIDVDPLPRYIVETIKLALSHFNVYINDLEVSANGQSPKIQQIERSNLYTLNIQLIQVGYEDYTSLQEVSGEVIEEDIFQDYDNAYFVDQDDSYFTGVQ